MGWLIGVLSLVLAAVVAAVIVRFERIERDIADRPTFPEMRVANKASDRYASDLFKLHEAALNAHAANYQHRRKPKAKK